MRENREKVMLWVFSDEGGYVLREDLGMAKYGIGLHTLYTYRKKHKLPIPVYDDVRNLSVEEASAIYSELFLDQMRFDELKSGVDYAVLDACINLGVHGGCDAVQRQLQLSNTGKWDNSTIEFLNNRDTFTVITEIRDAWISLKRKAPRYPQRGPGWENRDKRVRERSKLLAGL